MPELLAIVELHQTTRLERDKDAIDGCRGLIKFFGNRCQSHSLFFAEMLKNFHRPIEGFDDVLLGLVIKIAWPTTRFSCALFVSGCVGHNGSPIYSKNYFII